MVKYVNKIRVRYNETDKMGIVYHGNYAVYFEASRLEMLRSRGLSYREMEEMGVMLPVAELKVKYIKSAYYDDVLDVEVTLRQKPSVRVLFDYSITNQNGELVATGSVTLACVDAVTRRPCRAPEYFFEVFPGIRAVLSGYVKVPGDMPAGF